MILILNFLLMMMLTNVHDFQSKRELLLFTDDTTDTRLPEQKKILSGDPAGMEERDLLVRVLTNGKEKNDPEKSLQKKYNPEMKPFLLILIGKDGGEKFRSETPVSAAELFAIIDAMPMRQAEQKGQDRSELKTRNLLSTTVVE